MARPIAAGSSARPSLGWFPPIGRLPPPFARLLNRPLAVLPRRATPKRLAAALAALALLGGGWLWLRSSPLVAVEHVQISGVQGVDAGPIDAALQTAARRMSTLNVNVGALRAAVAPYRVVKDLSVSTSFPHGLRIHVEEQLPVAVLSAAGVHDPVAADGVVLEPGLLASLHASLPTIALADYSAPFGGRVQNATVRAELSVLGAAPHVLLGWVANTFTGREGLTVAMRGGVLIYFGDATRPHAKWLAAARVLADPSSAGATYVDVRAPERPAAGTTAAAGLGGAASTGAGGASAGQVSASDPISAELANVLTEAVNGSSGSPTSPGSPVAATAAASATGSAAAGSPATGPAAVASPTESPVTGSASGAGAPAAGAAATEAMPGGTGAGGPEH